MSRARRERRAVRQRLQEAPASTQGTSVSALWIPLGLVLAVGAAYWPVRGFGFVRFDDPLYVTENSRVLDGLTWSGVWWSLSSGHAANWHPVTWMSHMLDVQLFGVNAGAHHATNVVLHAITTVMLFWVLRRMTGTGWPSFLVAGLFGLHPLHVESVAWVAERKDVLSALFWVLSLGAYHLYTRVPRASRFIWVVVCFVLGLMAKPMVVTLPFVLLLLDVWPLRRLDLWSARTSLRPLVVEKLPLFALAAASAVVTFLAQQQGGAVASSARLPLIERLGNAALSYVAYIVRTVWPERLAAYYPYPRSVPLLLVAAALLLLIAATVGAARVGRHRPYVLVGWLWYLGTLVPVIGIVQVGTQAMADRYTYLPLIGLFIVLAWTLHDFIERHPARRRLASIAVGALLVLCAVVTRRQVRHWASSEALWTHALAVTSDNYAAHTYLGNALASTGRVDSAIVEYTIALRLRPDFPEAHNNLGPALAGLGRTDDAIAHFTSAIRLRPNYADAHNNLGVALASRGEVDEAVTHYRDVLRIDPDHPHAHGNLGLALRALGRTAEAAHELSLALRMNPNKHDLRAALNDLRSLESKP